MILAIIRYIPSAIIDLVADILALVLAPVAACFVARIDGRDHIHPYWRWITTHDTTVDAWWRGSYGRDGWIKRRFNSAGYRRSAVLRWACRVLWIWRNPAYQVAHWLGYDQTGVDTTRGLYKDPRWDSGKPNKAFWRVKNKKDKQVFWHKASCITIRTGALSTSSAGSCTGAILTSAVCWLFGYRRLRGIHEDKINSRLENMV